MIPISCVAPKNISSSSRNTLKRHPKYLFDEHWKGTEDCQVKVRHGSLWQLALVYIVYNVFVLFTINKCLCREAHSSQRLGQAVSKQLQRKLKKKKKEKNPIPTRDVSATCVKAAARPSARQIVTLLNSRCALMRPRKRTEGRRFWKLQFIHVAWTLKGTTGHCFFGALFCTSPFSLINTSFYNPFCERRGTKLQ